MFDERMLQFISRLSEMHLDPSASDPRKIQEIPDDARTEDEGRPEWQKDDLKSPGRRWGGIYKDVGIFSDHDWNFLMSKCLASMGKVILFTKSDIANCGVSRNSFGRLGIPTYRPVR